MEQNIEASVINLWLERNAPKIPLTDKSMFRLVWSDDQFEIRTGTKIYYFGNKKIAEAEETGKFPKYSWLHHVWVLEMWANPEIAYTPELPDSVNGSFEPIYAFVDPGGNPLPLNQHVVELVIKVALRPKSSSQAIRSRIFSEMAEKEARLDQYTLDAIDTSDMQSLLHHGEAGLVPGNYDILPPNLRRKQDD